MQNMIGGSSMNGDKWWNHDTRTKEGISQVIHCQPSYIAGETLGERKHLPIYRGCYLPVLHNYWAKFPAKTKKSSQWNV